MYAHLIFDNKPEIYNENRVSLINGFGSTGCLHIEEDKQIQTYYPVQKSGPSGLKNSS